MTKSEESAYNALWNSVNQALGGLSVTEPDPSQPKSYGSDWNVSGPCLGTETRDKSPVEIAEDLGMFERTTAAPEFDKNTPGSLKQLRWAVYWVIDNYYSEDSRVAAEKRKQAVEDLFKKYTNS